MEIFNHPSPTEYQAVLSPYRLLLNSHNDDLQLFPDDPSRFHYRAPDDHLFQPLTLQASKPVGGSFNFFYFEVDILQPGKWVLMCYSTQGMRIQSIPGRTTLWGFPLSVLIRGENIAIYQRRNRVFDKRLPPFTTVGLGVHILNMKLFLTIDGILETEIPIQRLPTCYPSVTLTPGAEIRVQFAHPRFNVLGFSAGVVRGLRKSTSLSQLSLEEEEGSRTPEKKRNKINKKKTAEVVAEFLKLRGFGKTLEKFKASETFKDAKGKKSKEFKSRKDGKKPQIFTKLREEVNSGNWEYFFEEPCLVDELSDYLRANVAVRALLQKYQDASTEANRIALLDAFSVQYADLRDEEILGASTTLGGVLCALMCDDGSFEHLLSTESRQEILETFFEHSNPKKCELLNSLRYLEALLQTNAQLNGFEAGHYLGNFQF
jgi:hypothetical protein